MLRRVKSGTQRRPSDGARRRSHSPAGFSYSAGWWLDTARPVARADRSLPITPDSVLTVSRAFVLRSLPASATGETSDADIHDDEPRRRSQVQNRLLDGPSDRRRGVRPELCPSQGLLGQARPVLRFGPLAHQDRTSRGATRAEPGSG